MAEERKTVLRDGVKRLGALYVELLKSLTATSSNVREADQKIAEIGNTVDLLFTTSESFRPAVFHRQTQKLMQLRKEGIESATERMKRVEADTTKDIVSSIEAELKSDQHRAKRPRLGEQRAENSSG
eukprot:Sspe_Gene.80800::Locus_51201_Transcript_1_1_Confidence_1.000_Length_574::g.80800::m.80800